MSSPTPRRCPALKDGFAWYEKLGARVGVAALVCVGAIGIYLENPAAALGYLLFAPVAGLLLVYDLLCVYCPYPYERSVCLFFPPRLLTGVAKRRRGPIPRIRKALFFVVPAGLVLIPQYWLWANWGLLAGFWVLAAPIGLTFLLHYCRRCRHRDCPLNRARGIGARQAADGRQ